MKLDLQEIETFIQVVEHGSVSVAAERLAISKSVVSKRLSDLEKRLEAKLLFRSTRKVTPTENGVQLYQQANGSLLALEPGVRPTDDQIYALYPRSSRASRKVLALCDFLQQALATQPWTQKS